MLVTLSEASRIPGAPLQPSLARMTKNKAVPPYLVNTAEGWRVDTDNEHWIARCGGAAQGQLRGIMGNAVREARAAERQPENEGAAEDPLEQSVNKALNAKIIFGAQREKIKKELDELKLNAEKRLFVEKAEAEYWFSFLQRGITDSFSVIRRCMPEVKRLITVGDELAAERYVCETLKNGFEQTRLALADAIGGNDDGD